MKENAEERNEHARADFFDWWDGFETRVAHSEEKTRAMDEGTRDAARRASSHLPCRRSQ